MTTRYKKTTARHRGIGTRQAISSPVVSVESSPSTVGVNVVTHDDLYEVFDRAARKYFEISGEEFARKLDAGEFGEIDNPYQPKVWRVAMLRPSAG